MGTRKAEAMKFRLKGHSYNEIQHTLGVPKSTLSGWFKELVLSDEARLRLATRSAIGSQSLLKRNKMQTPIAWRRAKSTRTEAAREIGDLSEDDMRLVGIALYWAEGYKRLRRIDGREITGHPISFVNADADMIRFFIRFLVESMQVPTGKIRAGMRLYPHINENDALCHWLGVTGLSKGNFFKTTWLVSISSQRKRRFNVLPYGTVQIQVSDTEKFHRLMGWIEGVKASL